MKLPPALQALHEERLAELTHNVKYRDAFRILEAVNPLDRASVLSAARALMPWKKGPFDLGEEIIDGEWDCRRKWQRLVPHLGDLREQLVLDLGCNNGWYMYQLRESGAPRVVGFDPMPLNWMQWRLMQKLRPDPGQEFYLLGVEDLPSLPQSFSMIVSFGVLYHHRNPIQQLLDLREALIPGGTLFLETIGIPGDDSHALLPQERYANMPNVWFLPTLKALTTMLERTRFTQIEVLATQWDGTNEQRATSWMTGPSYRDVLDPLDPEKTLEGHPAPRRFMIKALKKKLT